MSTADVRASQIVVGFWRRVFADLLDSLVLMIFGFAIGYPFRHAFSSMGLHALWVGLACSFLYFGILHTRFGSGQTLGKRWLGIQVLKRDGSFLSLGSSLIRYLAVSFVVYNGLYGSLLAFLPAKASIAVGSVFLLLVIWAFFACFLLIPMHPLKRGLHDLAAGSVVVYKGCYNAAAIDRMENPAKASRALWILSGGTLVVAGLFVAGLLTIQSHLGGDLDELSRLAATLSRDYDIRVVKDLTPSSGGQPILSVEVFLPLARFEDKADRERTRNDVYKRIQGNFRNLGRYQKVRIIILSGFDLGIASIKVSDAGNDTDPRAGN
jgi:uncharacterized RDD family membrane protein YckC